MCGFFGIDITVWHKHTLKRMLDARISLPMLLIRNARLHAAGCLWGHLYLSVRVECPLSEVLGLEITIFVYNPLHGSDVNFFAGGTWCWYSKYLRFWSPLHQGLEMIPNLQYPGFILFCLYRISYSLVWPQMHYLAKDDPIFLSFAPGVIGMYHPGHVYAVCWGLNSASDILGKRSTDWVTFPS